VMEMVIEAGRTRIAAPSPAPSLHYSSEVLDLCPCLEEVGVMSETSILLRLRSVGVG
jgi:hypothetical protein